MIASGFLFKSPHLFPHASLYPQEKMNSSLAILILSALALLTVVRAAGDAAPAADTTKTTAAASPAPGIPPQLTVSL